jgi:hyperosmotically inducible protein
MKKTLVLSALMAVGVMGAAAYAGDADSDHPGTYVKDSVITTKVKTKLIAKHMATLSHIKVDTDANGAVWLSGTAPSKDASDLAEQITKDTDGVTSVHNRIHVEE